MQFLNMFVIASITAVGPTNTSFIDDTTGQPVVCIYEDYQEEETTSSLGDNEVSICSAPGYIPTAPDTTSISDAHSLTGEGYYYAEEYSYNDTYDYVKYTAPYTRNIYLSTYATNNARVTVTVYNNAFSMTEPWRVYYSDDPINIYSTIYVGQGETLYFKVSCSTACTWESTLYLDMHNCGIAYFNKNNLHGYNLPHDGLAYIPYKFDSSALAYVPNQNYTWKNVFLEAMDVWEACGNVVFYETSTTNNAPITVNSGYDPYEVHINSTSSGGYYISQIEIPGDTDYYGPYWYGEYNRDGSAVTLRQAILGTCVQAIGNYIGMGSISLSPYRFNMMHTSTKPYFGCLGEGDIGSLIYLWGDANE